MVYLFPWLWQSRLAANNPRFCGVVGTWCQFWYLCGCLWYLCIAWCLFKLLFNVRWFSVGTSRTIHTLFTWLTAIILTAIPYLGDAYGAIHGDGSDGDSNSNA